MFPLMLISALWMITYPVALTYELIEKAIVNNENVNKQRKLICKRKHGIFDQISSLHTRKVRERLMNRCNNNCLQEFSCCYSIDLLDVFFLWKNLFINKEKRKAVLYPLGSNSFDEDVGLILHNKQKTKKKTKKDTRREREREYK
jgi:hypothetical protein